MNKTITKYMVLYELRNVTGNPFVHIFGVGMPIFMAILITRISISEIPDASVMKMLSTSIFLGIGAMIPMATILMGYAVRQAQDLEKGIPERMRLFGIRNRVTICNRAVSELIYMAAAFGLYFLAGILFMNLEAPVLSGFVLYAVCMLFFSIMCFMLGHAVAALAKRFSLTYCIVMMVYFACMIFGGMMGISYGRTCFSAPPLGYCFLLPYGEDDRYQNINPRSRFHSDHRRSSISSFQPPR